MLSPNQAPKPFQRLTRVGDIAKSLGIPSMKMNKALQTAGIFNSHNLPRGQHKQLFKVETGYFKYPGTNNYQTYAIVKATPQGLKKIEETINQQKEIAHEQSSE